MLWRLHVLRYNVNMRKLTDRMPGSFTPNINDSYPITGPTGQAGEKVVVDFCKERYPEAVVTYYPDDERKQFTERIDLDIVFPDGTIVNIDAKATRSILERHKLRFSIENLIVAIDATPDIVWWW